MDRYVLDFQDIDEAHIGLVGGKGAHLAQLSRIEGVRVPPGFCVTTDAYQRIIAQAPSLDERLDRLAGLAPEDREAIRALSEDIRRLIEDTATPAILAAAIARALGQHGEHAEYAVRSSATTEDLPHASFAGQHDSYLNIVGADNILRHISRCWASLFTERAVTYRLRNGFDHRKASMAVIVQQKVFPRASGILFTADPVSGNRRVSCVDASFGLGEALVSGLVNPDTWKVRGDAIVGGTRELTTEVPQRVQAALTDEQVVQLVRVGRVIEAHVGAPQDIEWCLADDGFHIVQSRPITTLFPIPVVEDEDNHVYLSVGHQQMMTDATPPLAISIRQLTGAVHFHEAGGRLFVDVSRQLAAPTSRAGLLGMIGKSDPLTRDALQTLISRDFIASLPDPLPASAPTRGTPPPIETDPAIVATLIAKSKESIAELTRDIATKSGVELFDFILTDMQELKRILFDPGSHQVFMAAMDSSAWLNEHLMEWIGEKSAADTLTLSVPDNVTSEMGLELLDVADTIRPHPEVVAFLRTVDTDDFLGEMSTLAGGNESKGAILSWLEKYGMRGVGEIDIARPRWSERPTMLLPTLLGHIDAFAPGEHQRRFELGVQAAWKKEQEVLERLRALPDGALKAEEAKRHIDRVRTFIGYREYPKYGMVSRYFVYKQALLKEAEALVRTGVLAEKGDIFWLTFQELQEVVRSAWVDYQLIGQRKDAFRSYQRLTPPRVLTSEGEMLSGSYRRDDVPPGALVGLAVSAGTVDGRARVIFDPASANLEPGDILVTTFTDPGWTSLFVGISGLVTEVGGLMTHGSVIAREYGLPAVVGVENATILIRDGQRIRIHGTEGYVELLS